jgi:metal-sulfur cluster biosynthetic enzyme
MHKQISFQFVFLILLSTLVLAQDSANSRSDSLETKLELLRDAIACDDFDLARSLTASLRDTLIQTQHEQQPPPASLIEPDDYHTVDQLTIQWQSWAAGWSYFKSFTVREANGIARVREPIELSLSFPVQLTTSLVRELRVATVIDQQIREVPCQVFAEVRRGSNRHCQMILLLDSPPNHTQHYFLFFGNKNAELPNYPSDLTVQGQGYDLDIHNAHFKASLSDQTGQLERLTLRREHGLELFAGGEGHGEPPGIDWAHDYVDEGGFQKLRISLWDRCPDFEVIAGPLCTIVRRWGFPHSPIHPVYTPSKLHIEVEYRFYSGLPWFHKLGKMKAIQSFTAEALRDDEWVFSGQSFTDGLWLDKAGKLQFSPVPTEQQDQIWGVGFYHRDTKDSFIALFLDHSAIGIPELKHNGAPLIYYRWHGHVWSRYPLPVKEVPQGAMLTQKNAYLVAPFTRDETEPEIESLRASMMSPLQISSNQSVDEVASLQLIDQSDQLARPGEGDEATAVKAQLWAALADCKDAQLYKADINVVELGLVYDVRLRGSVATIVMAPPHPGRSRLGYFIDGSVSVHPTLSVPIRQRLLKVPGVKQVVFEQLPSNTWNSNRLNDSGREKLGLPSTY